MATKNIRSNINSRKNFILDITSSNPGEDQRFNFRKNDRIAIAETLQTEKCYMLERYSS